MLKHGALTIHELNHNYYWWNHVILVRHRIDLAMIVLLIAFGILYLIVSKEDRPTVILIFFISIFLMLAIPYTQSIAYIIPNHSELSHIQNQGYLDNTSNNMAHVYCYDDKESIKMLPTIQKELKKLKIYHQELIIYNYYTIHAHNLTRRIYYLHQYKKNHIKYQKLKKRFKHNQYTLHFVVNFRAPHLVL